MLHSAQRVDGLLADAVVNTGLLEFGLRFGDVTLSD
jgi:hypothetical protein